MVRNPSNRPPLRRLRVLSLVVVMAWSAASVPTAPGSDVVEFGRDIRPLLADRCFKCHGPDAEARQAALRLDLAASAHEAGESGEIAILPGKPHESELWRRVNSQDDAERMPPPEAGEPLTASQIAQLEAWIEAGAQYEPHWAFVPPRRPQTPQIESNWPRGPIDRFVLQKLRERDLEPSPVADRHVLVRRVYLDLIGLPPSIEEVEQFLADTRPDAYERLVDRLLASPHYGERMAQDWLDLARYSDTTGYAADRPRSMWLYRDWVIKSLNENMPYDQFTIEQLAGDMLPEASVNQRIATGFHRNSMQALGNNPRKEEFRVKGIVDRVNTTGRVWLGLTVSCAECHDHKFDPIRQEEYYRLFAIFNNIPHFGKALGVHGPRMHARSPLADERLAQIDKELTALHGRIVPYGDRELAEEAAGWEARVRPLLTTPQVSSTSAPLIAHWPLDGTLDDRGPQASKTRLHGGVADWEAVASTSDNEIMPDGEGALRLGEKQFLRVANHEKLAPSDSLTISAWIRTTQAEADIVCKWDSVRGQRSFVFGIGGEGEENATPGHLYAWVSSTPDSFRGQQVYGSIPVHDGRWHHVAMIFRAGDRVDLYVDGERDEHVRRRGDAPTRLAASACDLILGGGYSLKPDPSSYFLGGSLADIRLYGTASEDVASLGAIPPDVRGAISIDRADRSAAQTQRIVDYFQKRYPGTVPEDVRRGIAALEQEQAFLEREHQAQVMAEMDEPRETHVLTRGNYLAPGARVEPGVPSFLPPLDVQQPVNRLHFARWLVRADHPLTARVAVNRFWQHFFGTGLVRTADDFGLQGEWPSHRELLDWLAVEFVESGWDMKALHREIVASATYRQSAAASAEAYRLDPANRWLARGPRFRLPAEQVRDNALAAAGLLSRKLGGPSIYPVQPAGLFEEKAQTMYHPVWITSDQPDRYRRGVYVYWKRMNLYPTMAIFDAPTRERCRVQRPRTNTPLQALALLNDPVYVEAARSLADLTLAHASDDAARLDFALRRCLARRATSRERDLYLAFLDRQRVHFGRQAEAAEAFAGTSTAAADVATTTAVPIQDKPDADAVDRAAWTALASVLLNLDEMITRP
ncbi:MAG: DUF1553 domain-containing protein [Planctomycetota bacterium]|nr:MAG: DUF1553 domain-containing protein [Planctomycetota bacterium]REK25732.1 MAG: DUF1553 domain-containing protein [Planctomycetota bacterium]REK46522.1 MAG: DUF1553 domain-containing protein [Planctomycetota bacterium]